MALFGRQPSECVERPSFRRPKTCTQAVIGELARPAFTLEISSCEDFFAEALGFLNVENGFSLAIFFEGSTYSIERIVAMGWLATFSEQGEIGQGEFFSGLRPKEWRVLAGPFLQRLMKRTDGLLQPGRPLLALARVASAAPKLVSVKARSSGTRSRGCSASARR